GLLLGSLLRSPFLPGARRLPGTLGCRPADLLAGRGGRAARRLPRGLPGSLAATCLLLFLGGCLLARHTTCLQEQLHETGDYTYEGRERKSIRCALRSRPACPSSLPGGALRRPSCRSRRGR